MRIGIYGGAFNPVHKGHVKLAEEVKAKAHLDKIIIMPSGQSPHKSSHSLMSLMWRVEGTSENTDTHYFLPLPLTLAKTFFCSFFAA